MKSGTRNLLLIGAAGLGAYFLFFRPQQAAQSSAIEGGAAGIASGFSNLGQAGLEGYNALWGAALAPFMLATTFLSSTAQGLIDNFNKNQNYTKDNTQGRIGSTTSSAPVATSFVPGYLASAALITNTPQQQLARQFNVPQSSINAMVNYASAPGYTASFSNAGSNMTGKYNPSTGSFISSTTGQGYSVPSYLVNATTPSKPSTGYTNPLQPSKPAYFK